MRLAMAENAKGNNKSQWEVVERALVAVLVQWSLIDPKFTGSITFHFNQGGVSDIDKAEKSLKKKLFSV